MPITPRFSEAEYNRGFKTFDPKEVKIRAAAITESVQEMLQDFLEHKSEAMRYLSAGKVNEVEGDYAFAVLWYERAIGCDPTLHEARARLAIAQVKASRPSEALPNAVKVTEDAPDLVIPALVRRRPLSVWTILGDVLRANNKLDAAREAYAKAIRAVPNDMYASGHYGVLLLSIGHYEEALRHLQNVDQANGTFGPILAAARLASNDPTMMIAIRDTYINSMVQSERMA